ncbi:hypothetical protein [Gandjariella thermophila]|uniref:Major facilitator superfamily (MFS) profile domain-containing protein n=1 Tax=Gandjariella thermophila TaxID=1931992 RepID=A0A4D4JD52_9PSEU|nr:hypothetical protein [Gandjariella thermophila]GDY32940.1 hypothetical protein GTS_45730 [Gandjariella thermophila]
MTDAPAAARVSRRPVLAYLAAATLARVADETVGGAVVLLVLDRTGSSLLAGAVVTAYTLPSLVSGPLLGAWVAARTRAAAASAG